MDDGSLGACDVSRGEGFFAAEAGVPGTFRAPGTECRSAITIPSSLPPPPHKSPARLRPARRICARAEDSFLRGAGVLGFFGAVGG